MQQLGRESFEMAAVGDPKPGREGLCVPFINLDLFSLPWSLTMPAALGKDMWALGEL